MLDKTHRREPFPVALRKESVDRNYMGVTVLGIQHKVALRKESVDRNYKERPGQKARPNVALRKESVDRNPENPMISVNEVPVALRKESVDRNKMALPVCSFSLTSLSARRAWIEIVYPACQGPAL